MFERWCVVLLRGAGVGCALVWSTSAWGQAAVSQGYSIDIELMQPTFGHRSLSGVDVPLTHRDRTVRAGTLLQYQQAPLTLYDAVSNEEVGGVVTHRFSATVGASVDLQRFTLGVAAPLALSWGSEQPAFAADGVGAGDVALHARYVVARTPRDGLALGVRGGLRLPTGAQRSYLGEGRVRLAAGALLSANVGPLMVASDLGVRTRRPVETDEDFFAATEVAWSSGARLMLPDAARLSFNAQLLAVAGSQQFLMGGAENSLEMLAGVDIYPTSTTTLGLSAGRGLNQGYGTTDLRVLGNLVVELAPPVRQRGPMDVFWPPPPPVPPVKRLVDDGPPPPVRDTGAQLELSDPLMFEVRTARLLPESLPTLQAVADHINADPELGLIIVEGHASEEGEVDFNYELADKRARRIWELLLERGVAHQRITYRHFGETKPRDGELAASRRVEFGVAVRYDGPDQAPIYPATQRLPWSDDEVEVVSPQWPAVPGDLLEGDLDEATP
ncbi:MAG: OmpA family protein [Myxococcales bacterium]|nr:OmpA family protein [Myxococcales bacterium]